MSVQLVLPGGSVRARASSRLRPPRASAHWRARHSPSSVSATLPRSRAGARRSIGRHTTSTSGGRSASGRSSVPSSSAPSRRGSSRRWTLLRGRAPARGRRLRSLHGKRDHDRRGPQARRTRHRTRHQSRRPSAGADRAEPPAPSPAPSGVSGARAAGGSAPALLYRAQLPGGERRTSSTTSGSSSSTALRARNPSTSSPRTSSPSTPIPPAIPRSRSSVRAAGP